MRIIINELKKIFNIKFIILLVLINIIMYFLFIEFEITNFPNGRPALDIYNMLVEMEDSYGEFMDGEEFDDFKVKYEEVKREADKYIQSREDFKRAGINNYDEFASIDITNKELDRLHDDVFFEKEIDVFWELPWREEYIRVYENRKEIMMEKSSNEKQETRIKDILENDIETSVFSDVIFFNYNNLIKPVVTTILLSVMFMITPIYLIDNKNRINYLQYTSKIGRKIFKKKIIAGLLASFIVVTIQFICFFSLYATNNTFMFLNSNINSIYNTIISWYDLTFIQYISLSIIGTYILAFVFTLTSMLVSTMGQNYITVIGIQLPIALFTFMVLLKHLIYYMTSIRYPKYFLGLSYIILILISTIYMIIRWRREKKIDIVY
ncbi:ABC transporter permease [Clostridiisalibacter paucivorans]|uniref:ABC transporter permease n=1 Tax=Clostridiisalibacter paucivorans TaxID=408753 RepID=UPI0004794404|nr:ABC transporter permease [Clostridiisalibacter paucivorans]